MNNRKIKTSMLWVLILVTCLLYVHIVTAEPAGASMTYNSTDNGPTSTATGINNSRGTITTIVLQATQQDTRWKGYVGNVTGTLALSNSAGQAIYDWTNLANPTGEVYATRSSSLNFASVQCAQVATIGTEMTFNNMTGLETDAINSTFNSTDHTSMIIAGTSLSNCPYASLYVSGTSQGQDNNDDFQEILVEDAGANLIYVSMLNDNTVGFDGTNYDFQMIVAESNVKATPTSYYFYVELG